MNNVINVIAFIAITLSSSLLLSAQAAENNYKQGYISDDLFIYMHAGPGKNYRILGTVIAGSKIKITGAKDGGYSEIITEDNKATWIESKYVTTKKGLRFAVDELNEKIANNSDYSSQLDNEVSELKNQLNLVTNEKETLSAELKKMTSTLATTQRKIKNQDSAIKKEWFFNGALVLGIGLILGLILPRFFARRRASMDNWS
ncbi:TIGR04211 family SH3 domain-containing protein [Colwellia ponticola]|uniref:TIGR04211 family SH3 domain-containing protein n=1 Tax=Colwellia ponticola TaxID=2304625 RepID=A0A8H2JQT8_9GAMM|nr:TIGR04211 family SH3 domain-containing protein [Colwellia ponticola]TMM47523.1 TIGR04211 family SH3 domain-containing protein [Colwellia ponticola]